MPYGATARSLVSWETFTEDDIIITCKNLIGPQYMFCRTTAVTVEQPVSRDRKEVPN